MTRFNSSNSIIYPHEPSPFKFLCFNRKYSSPISSSNAEWDIPALGQIRASATASATYDSRVFGIPSTYFNQIRSSGGNPGTGIAVDELKSEDDFILKFSPAVHLARKVSLFQFAGSAGIEIAQYIKNDEKSYIIPVTNFSIDFDETLSKNKRISNNAKIRFDAVLTWVKVSPSVLEQDC